MERPFNIELEACGCPPFMRGMIFRRQGDLVWVVMETDALYGTVKLQLYRLPKPVLEEDKDD